MATSTENHSEIPHHDLQWANPAELHLKRLNAGVSAAAEDAYRAVIAQMRARVAELERIPADVEELVRIHAKTEELTLQIDSLEALLLAFRSNPA